MGKEEKSLEERAEQKGAVPKGFGIPFAQDFKCLYSKVDGLLKPMGEKDAEVGSFNYMLFYKDENKALHVLTGVSYDNVKGRCTVGTTAVTYTVYPDKQPTKEDSKLAGETLHKEPGVHLCYNTLDAIKSIDEVINYFEKKEAEKEKQPPAEKK
jgi:hypothetical protein